MNIDNNLYENNHLDSERIQEEKGIWGNLREFENENPLEINSSNPEKLSNFLKAVSNTHTWYHHYTTLDCLQKILENKTFKMTRGVSRKLNDLHESIYKGDENIWEKTYITCFSYGGEDKINYKSNKTTYSRLEENMAMWGLYGKPKTDAVRITIPQETFCALSSSECIINSKLELPVNVFTTDVFYTKGNSKSNGPKSQIHIDKKIIFNIGKEKLFNFFAKPEFTGCVKNYSWHYEDEVRIISQVGIGFNYEDKEDFILLKFPEHLLKTFKITSGPNFTKFRELEELLKSYPGISYSKSLLDGNVNFNDEYEDIGRTIVDLATKIKKLTKRRKND